ncbi:Type 1 glutamine amidotransferase-like domain-containing protein [Halobacillus salinarum]|uniref:Type 1 glutamine amidotransferase-like domain-containing protein n=1 Tax=Halobacillus salinarum TaxID=2932257 RepID=A0ABY4EKR9_9BACI|nr:Type 1 glutamine amidotransferase-like domain-containing protein [Halobacillus salinarum]UOQ44234.1 Type 1 glutamine amidotransferase-like domain-containing protein [Halobacillus salinarum]
MKQIIALGGGGFSEEPENPLLDEYILHQAQKEKPKICYVPTANGDSDICISWFYDFFKKQNCEPSHLSLFKPPTRDLEGYVLEKDIIYVGGGNTKNLLVLWKEWGLDSILKKAWEQGVILAGISAGSICWFEDAITDSYGDQLEPIRCLGMISGSNCPHYDEEEKRRPAYHKFMAEGKVKPGIAADDGVGLHYMDQHLHRIVSSRPEAGAYHVSYEGQKVKEVPLETDYLE